MRMTDPWWTGEFPAEPGGRRITAREKLVTAAMKKWGASDSLAREIVQKTIEATR
jgi:hypothetical protein